MPVLSCSFQGQKIHLEKQQHTADFPEIQAGRLVYQPFHHSSQPRLCVFGLRVSFPGSLCLEVAWKWTNNSSWSLLEMQDCCPRINSFCFSTYIIELVWLKTFGKKKGNSLQHKSQDWRTVSTGTSLSREATEVIQGLELLCCGGRLRYFGLFSLG